MVKQDMRSDDGEAESKKRKLIETEEDMEEDEEDPDTASPPKKKVKNRSEDKTPSNASSKKDSKRAASRKTETAPSAEVPGKSSSRKKKAAAGKASESTGEAPSNSTNAAAAAPVVPSKVPQIEKLRIPSHQTPGKHPPTASITTEDASITQAPKMRLMLGDEKKPANSKDETTESKSEEVKIQDTVPDEDKNDVQEQEFVPVEKEPIWSTLGFWLVTFFCCHYFVPYGSVSTSLLNVYKGQVSPPYNVTEEAQREANASKRIYDQIDLMLTSRTRLKKARDNIYQDISDVEHLIESLSVLKSQIEVPWLEELDGNLQSIEQLIRQDEWLSPYTIKTLKSLLGEKVSEHLLDLSHLDLWNISTVMSECEQPVSLTEGDVLDAHRKLSGKIHENSLKLRNDERVRIAIVDWVHENAAGRFDQPIVVEVPATQQQRPRGSHINSIRKVIQARVDVEAADRTGKVDYATLANGGTVIKTGAYATSPSLVEKLPYGNRLLHALSLRFYGHGPEAALMPTVPHDALGQCWSFTPYKSDLSRYAVFTVKLGRPIYASQLSIEHPPRELNDRVKTAIRIFSVVGFENDKATGKAWKMGRFEYRIGDVPLQSFVLDDEMEDQDIPAIQSISLKIDSNWGMSYSCLYRVRVHGSELE